MNAFAGVLMKRSMVAFLTRLRPTIRSRSRDDTLLEVRVALLVPRPLTFGLRLSVIKLAHAATTVAKTPICRSSEPFGQIAR